MSSYYPSFSYLEKNSADEGYIVTSFEPDEGFTDTFLGMDQVYEDYYDGTKRFLYGTRYNNKATISITLVKADGTDWTVNDNRKALRWLTGSRSASWLDLCTHKNEDGKWVPIYSFLGTVTTSQQYKLDGRIIGLSFEFSSITPWAYSEEKGINRPIEQELYVDSNGVLFQPNNAMSIDSDGVLCNGFIAGEGADFCFNETDGSIYVENIIIATFDNQTDDLYSDIYLDITYTNESCGWLTIKRKLCDCDDSNGPCEIDDHYEITRINNLQVGEVINITGKQFIISYTKDQNGNLIMNPSRQTFGDDFNFVWPRLTRGINKLIIEGDGNGNIEFYYRYPMKVGDCAMDISTYGGDAICGSCDDIPSYNTVRWQDITGTPRSLVGYGITDAYNKVEADEALSNKADKATTLSGYGITDAYTTSEVYNKDEVYPRDIVYTKDEVDDKIDDIEISGGSGTGSVTIDEEKLNAMLEDILN